MTVPEWVRHAVFYQIFPDRFMNGNLRNDPPVVLPWNTCATPKGFHGGDLAGIVQRLDYLDDLGVNTLYLNPIFQSPSNHRYNTLDYYKIDPKLGDMKDFSTLVKAVHQRGMRLILDGVFNHTSRGFFAFNDILENGPDSPYIDWYTVKRFPLDAYTGGEAKNYLAWWNYKSLPKLNTHNPDVRRYLMDVARFWIEQGADGWRLDVPNEIDDDSFWAQFRAVVRSANPDAYLLGEIWDALPRWTDEHHFDGLMNYPIRTALLGLLTKNWTVQTFSDTIRDVLATYPWQTNLSMYILLGSHDTERILTALKDDVRKLQLATLFQFAFPGAPAIYYGDEIGLTGGKDPACRSGFPWERSYWNHELRAWFQKLAVLRRNTPALRAGDYRPVSAVDGQAVFAFARTLDHRGVVVVINPTEKPVLARLDVRTLGWHDGVVLCDLLSGDGSVVQGGTIECKLDAWSGVWLSTE